MAGLFFANPMNEQSAAHSARDVWAYKDGGDLVEKIILGR